MECSGAAVLSRADRADRVEETTDGASEQSEFDGSVGGGASSSSSGAGSSSSSSSSSSSGGVPWSLAGTWVMTDPDSQSFYYTLMHEAGAETFTGTQTSPGPFQVEGSVDWASVMPGYAVRIRRARVVAKRGAPDFSCFPRRRLRSLLEERKVEERETARAATLVTAARQAITPVAPWVAWRAGRSLRVVAGGCGTEPRSTWGAEGCCASEAASTTIRTPTKSSATSPGGKPRPSALPFCKGARVWERQPLRW